MCWRRGARGGRECWTRERESRPWSRRRWSGDVWPWRSSSFLRLCSGCSAPMSTERWQKTFTLKRRSKGCVLPSRPASCGSPPRCSGRVYLVTREILDQLEEGLKDKHIAILYLFLQHTSAGLSINENCDPESVAFSLPGSSTDRTLTSYTACGRIWTWHWTRLCPSRFPGSTSTKVRRLALPFPGRSPSFAGPDDSVSHTKSSIIGVSLCIPISRGKLALGSTSFRKLGEWNAEWHANPPLPSAWQGVYLHEFRNDPHTRKIVATM